jgi:probable HAF family extracellular repeat protein
MTHSHSSGAVLARLATVVLILFSSLGTDAPRSAAPPYSVIDLGTFNNVQSAQAFDVNDAGQVVGVAGGNRAFIWQNGSKTDLGSLPGGTSAAASGINEASQIVGYSAVTTPPTGRHAVMWSNGVITDLTPDLPANQEANATAINEAGQVVGQISYSTAFLWQGGSRTPLGDLGGGASAATDINDSGVVVGGSYTNQLTPLGLMQHPFMWNGVMSDLGLFPGDDDGSAQAINNAGHIVGSSGRMDPETYEAFYRAFIYFNGVMTPLPVPSPEAYASDINDAGVVVGTMRAGGAVSKYHAWVYVDGVVTNLNTLIPSGTGLHIAFANGVNNAGQIAATAYDAQFHYHAVLLTPGTGPPPTPTVSIGDVAVTEGSTGTVTLAYSTADGTATAGSDYDAAAGTLTIPAGRTSWSVSVTVRGDRKREPDEVFYVNLSSVDGATIGDGLAAGTIRSDDR